MKKKLLSALSVSLLLIGSAFAQTTFNYTGGVQTYTAPSSGTISIEAYGAQGGNGGPVTTGQGGLGGYSYGELSVTAGQTLYIYVGGQGQSQILSAATGGFNGGGGTNATSDDSKRPGCGGGASDVRVGGTALTNRVIVAGGGGGSSGWMSANGGAGGGLAGEDGPPPYHNSGYDGNGKGATQIAGGDGGFWNSSNFAEDGILGVGGRGKGYSHGGGGGGGGYYGGGGGVIEAGGGGSSYIGGVINGTTTMGLRSGNGQVVIDFLCVPTTLTVTNANLPNATGECSVTPTAPTAYNDCGDTVTGTTATVFPITTQGSTTITWNFTDGINSTSQTQTVIVDDVTDPVANVGSLAQIVECTSATPGTPTAFDNCSGTVFGTSNVSFPITTVGITMVTWTYDDGNGNTATQTQEVVITGGAPANDSCAGATAITAGTYFGNTECANPEIAPICGTGDGTGGAVWYSITPTTDEFIEVSLCNAGTDFDTKLRIYEGACDSLVCVTGDDDSPFCGPNNEIENWCAQAGTTYYILVHGYSSSEGTFEMTVTEIPTPTSMSTLITCADSVMINGNYYSSNQMVIDTLVGMSALGCDSIHTTNLMFDTYTLGTVNQSDCDSAMVFGTMYYSSQTIYDTILNGSVDGCDTITEVNLTITNGYTVEVDYSTCNASYFVGGATQTMNGVYTDTYTAVNGCDSIVETTLTLNAGFTTYYFDEEICSGESILLGGANQTTAGTYYDTIVTGGSCDSVIVTILDVLTSPSTTFNVTIDEGESHTFAGNDYTTSGTHTATYTAANGCDSTVTLNLTVNPIDGLENIVDGLSVYPNPTTGKLYINNEYKGLFNIDVVDLTGKVLITKEINTEESSIDLSDYDAGVYFVNFRGKDKSSTVRIMLK